MNREELSIWVKTFSLAVLIALFAARSLMAQSFSTGSGTVDAHIFFIKSDGSMYGWGQNEVGSLGIAPSSISIEDPQWIPGPTTGPSWSSTSFGDGSIGIANVNGFGKLYEWERYDVHQSYHSSYKPILIDISNVKAWRVEAEGGLGFGAAVAMSGELYTWGADPMYRGVYSLDSISDISCPGVTG